MGQACVMIAIVNFKRDRAHERISHLGHESFHTESRARSVMILVPQEVDPSSAISPPSIPMSLRHEPSRRSCSVFKKCESKLQDMMGM